MWFALNSTWIKRASRVREEKHQTRIVTIAFFSVKINDKKEHVHKNNLEEHLTLLFWARWHDIWPVVAGFVRVVETWIIFD